MKIVKQVKLFFKEGTSDKVYEIDLCEINASDFIVNFRYGKRGGALKDGTKTPAYVSLDKAEIIFADLESEKRKKGYQSELEVFIELPSIANIDIKTVDGSILKRLEDATQGINSFKTNWKISRVIWKAGILKIYEAIPFIIKLATKGDEMQLYSALFALLNLKAEASIELLHSISQSNRQKEYLRNLATEGLLTLTTGEVLEKVIADLFEKLPQEIKYFIDKGDYTGIQTYLQDKFDKNEKTDYLHILYLLAKHYQSLVPVIEGILEQLPFVPPYFKSIRAIYKLSKYRNDHQTLALLAYLFEKKEAMFTRVASLEKDAYTNSQYIPVLDQNINLRKELLSKDSRLAFSQFTKKYFQTNLVNQVLVELWKVEDAKEYLKLAVNILLKFKDDDYTPARREPVSNYGLYDYNASNNQKYIYTVYTYPECSNSFLLSSILFWDITNRLLFSNLVSYNKKEVYSSSEYYYNEDNLKKVVDKQERKTNVSTSTIEPLQVIGSIVNSFKNLWNKATGESKIEEKPPVENTEDITNNVVDRDRLELYPLHWDAFPQAYIQLLMEAQMNRIHQFAYTNLKAHIEYKELVLQLNSVNIITLLNKEFSFANEFGFEVLTIRTSEFYLNINFVAQVLACNFSKAREWSKEMIEKDINLFSQSSDFNISIILNHQQDQKVFIDNLLANCTFSNEQIMVIIGKVIIELLTLGNIKEVVNKPWIKETQLELNNLKVKLATERLKIIGSNQLHEISWEIIAQLLTSNLANNTLLASEILIIKSQKATTTEIPFAIIDLLLKDEDAFIRKNGIILLNQYPILFIETHWVSILKHLANENKEVVEAVIHLNVALKAINPNYVHKTMEHIIYALLKKENFEGANAIYQIALLVDCKDDIKEIPATLIIKLVFAFARESQLVGFELLKTITDPYKLTLKQVIALANHEILAIRQVAWAYFKENIARIKEERNVSLGLLDAKWDDSREFAFHFFNSEFTESDWDAECLVGIVDSVRPDVEKFGKDLIMRFFQRDQGLFYLTQLSQHPSVNIQMFVSYYLEEYASDQPAKLQELTFYFRSVLTRVNRARITKNRIFQFLETEGKKSEESAIIVSTILDDISATTAIQDKARCVYILTELKMLYPNLSLHLNLIV